MTNGKSTRGLKAHRRCDLSSSPDSARLRKGETETDAEERRRLLNFVVVGAGPTGVEMAGAIAELARKALAADFRAIDLSNARIILIEAGPRTLPSFKPSLSAAACGRSISSAWRRASAATKVDADGV
jgi:NADH dehydrogenase